MKYLPRVVDGELKSRKASIGAVLIEGPKASGKTATASRVAQTMFRLDADNNARSLVTLDPDLLFSQPTPIVFDEWQIEPTIWNQARRQVDDRREPGLFVLTARQLRVTILIGTPSGTIRAATNAPHESL